MSRSFLVVVVVLVAAVAPAQESVVFTPPSPRPIPVAVGGEHTTYLPDGGCTCQAVSRVPTPPQSCNGPSCAAARLRSRNAVLAAVDGGAENPQ